MPGAEKHHHITPTSHRINECRHGKLPKYHHAYGEETEKFQLQAW